MNTTQNRAMVLASALRVALKKLDTVRPERFAKVTRPVFDEAVEEIESVAVVLDKVAEGEP